MTTLRHASKAVEQLRLFLSINLPAFITTTATEEGATMPPPDIYRGAVHPQSVEPLALEVECESDEADDLHNEYWNHDCIVHLVLRGLDADAVESQKQIRRYVTALKQCIQSDPSLSNTVVSANIGQTTYAPASSEGILQVVSSTVVEVQIHNT